jgi:hypothetical protein
MPVDHQHAEVRKRLVPRWRQRQLVADPFCQLVRPGQNLEFEGKIGALRAMGP